MILRSSNYVVVAVLASLVLLSAVPGSGEDSPVRDDSDRTKVPSIDELLLFFPSKYPAGNWKPEELRFEDVWFHADDKTRLHGWHCRCDNPRATILIAHGNGGSIASRIPWLRYLQSELHVATFMFDYRGYGRSDGVPTVEGALQDARAARSKFRELEKVQDAEMMLMGESLGGAIVVQLAAESAPRDPPEHIFVVKRAGRRSLSETLVVSSTEEARLRNTNFPLPWSAPSKSRRCGSDDPISLRQKTFSVGE